MHRKAIRIILSAIFVLIVLQSAASAEKPQVARPDRWIPWEPYMYQVPAPEGEEAMFFSAAADTYYLACYDFELFDWQGWSGEDLTAQHDTFFHVDDFAGLGGGDRGFLVPIEGTKSMWCGARPGSDFYMCGWTDAPGYGNYWSQVLDGGVVSMVSGPVTISYHGRFDSEPGYDRTNFEYFGPAGWTELASIDGVVDTVVTHTLILAQVDTKLRFRFTSDNLYSDEDGIYASDGACVIDSITIAVEGGVIDFEDFESADVGATGSGRWLGQPGASYGKYSGLDAALDFCAKDPCGTNNSTQIIFFEGSEDPYPPCPGLFVTPFCQDLGFCQEEIVYSPIIDMTKYSTGRDETQDADIPAGDLGGLIMRFTVYQDLPYGNDVYYNWIVREFHDGCPGPWQNTLYLSSGSFDEYLFRTVDLSFVLGNEQADSIQVGFLVKNWDIYDEYGENHTPSPWFDNVKVIRYSTSGPQWQYSFANLFQDKFPASGEIGGFVRADMARDISPAESQGIYPGDSIVVECLAPEAGGLDTLGTGEERVYLHCRASYIGGNTPQPDLAGPQLEGDYGSYVSDDGEWTVLLCEQVKFWGIPAPDKYCVDLNDELFTCGYMIEYYFKAYDLDGVSTTLPEKPDKLFEFTCLPTLQDSPSILYVDDYHGRGSFEGIVELYMNRVLYQMPRSYDRYDVNGPSMRLSNGIGAYVSAEGATSMFCQVYDMVIFDSGDLNECTISDGDYRHSDKSNDVRLLLDWMNYSNHKTGLWVLGDGVATDLSGSVSADAVTLMGARCGVDLRSSSYFYLSGGLDSGGMPSPPVTGVGLTPFDGLNYYADGGCPILKDFDVLEITGIGEYCLKYADYGGEPAYAGIFTEDYISPSRPARTVWNGHSIMAVRDGAETSLSWIPARAQLGERVYQFLMEGATYGLTDSDIPVVTSLSKNFPNPFNPSTRISYTLAGKGHVSMRIYDVAGRLVCVLVDEVKDAGSYEAVWNGKNDAGQQTVSGVYFCRMQAEDFERTQKMVMLR